MKTYKISTLILMSLSSLFVNANASLPPCRDCKAEDAACYAQADSDFASCIDTAENIYQSVLDAISQETQNLISSNCGEDDGGVVYSGCVYFWTAASGPARATAFSINQIHRSQCRTDRNWAKSTCDANYLLCVNAVAAARSNGECGDEDDDDEDDDGGSNADAMPTQTAA